MLQQSQNPLTLKLSLLQNIDTQWLEKMFTRKQSILHTIYARVIKRIMLIAALCVRVSFILN